MIVGLCVGRGEGAAGRAWGGRWAEGSGEQQPRKQHWVGGVRRGEEGEGGSGRLYSGLAGI